MTRPVATISVDVDPVDLHLLGYGFQKLPPDAVIYRKALPRLLDVFAKTGVTATFFIVGRDVEPHADIVRAIAERGHGIASHSYSHPFAFRRLRPASMRHELVESRRVLEKVCGRPVVGYRSPNFDMDAAAIKVLIETGYRYDASAYPTLMLLPARVLLAIKGRRPGAFKLTVWPFTFERQPYRWQVDGGSIAEFPISVTPWTRFPIYHTARYYMSTARFERVLDGFVRRSESLSYPLHAVDGLGLVEDDVDARLAPHPGMSHRLDSKLALLESSLAAITARFDTVPFEDRFDSV